MEKLDVLGCVCPVPVMKALRKFEEISSGEQIELLTDDPLAIKTIPDEITESEAKVEVIADGRHWKVIITKK